MCRTGSRVPHCLYCTSITVLPILAVRTVQRHIACSVQLYHLFSYAPYEMYWYSVPVQYSSNTTNRMYRTGLRSLSDVEYICTSSSTMGLTACIGSQCMYSTNIPLLRPLSVQILRNSVKLHYIYNSTTPISRTVSKASQCLYSISETLLILWAVRAVGCLSACRLPLELYYPMGSTVTKEPQVLYRTPITLLQLRVVRTLQRPSSYKVPLNI